MHGINWTRHIQQIQQSSPEDTSTVSSEAQSRLCGMIQNPCQSSSHLIITSYHHFNILSVRSAHSTWHGAPVLPCVSCAPWKCPSLHFSTRILSLNGLNMLVQNMSKPNHSSRGGVLYALITRGESESGGMLVLYTCCTCCSSLSSSFFKPPQGPTAAARRGKQQHCS